MFKRLDSKNRPMTIGEKLKKEKCRILKKSFFCKSTWKQLEEAYRQSENNPKFIESTNWKRDSHTLEKLQKKVEEVILKEYSKKNHDLYIMAKKWCVYPHTLRKKALKMGFTFLNMNLESNKDDTIWEMRIRDYQPNENEINLIHILRLNDPKISLQKKIRNLKITAKKLIDLMNYEEYSEEAWNSITRWFTKERPYKEYI